MSLSFYEKAFEREKRKKEKTGIASDFMRWKLQQERRKKKNRKWRQELERDSGQAKKGQKKKKIKKGGRIKYTSYKDYKLDNQ